MNEGSTSLACGIVNKAYIQNANSALQRVESMIQSLMAQRRLPDDGWSDDVIQYFLNYISLMDSNNYVGNVGVGEREGRVYSNLVKQRHSGLSHGIGRSGDLIANQPKAAGSSLLYSLTNLMVADTLRLAGIKLIESAMVVPLATGMSLSLVLQSLSSSSDSSDSSSDTSPTLKKKWIIWSRIDQKTCLKCIYTAGFKAKVIELIPDPENKNFYITDIEGMEKAIEECGGSNNIHCVLSTTSCFAPRSPDKVLDISRMCKKHNIPHVINNAYGVQSSPIMKAINSSIEHGRVDAIIQSGDKNFMVPVGGSVIATPTDASLKHIAATYAGRASGSPILDMFITLLSLGRVGYKRLLSERQSALTIFHSKMNDLAAEFGETTLISPRNDISFCITLSSLPNPQVTALGSALFNHCVSGPRVVKLGEKYVLVYLSERSDIFPKKKNESNTERRSADVPSKTTAHTPTIRVSLI